MKKQFLIIALGMLLASIVQAEDLSDFLPFIQAPAESQGQDLAQIQQLLMDYDLELGMVENRIAELEEQQKRLEGQLQGFQILGTGLGQLRCFQITGSGKEQALDFLSRPLWYDAIEQEVQTRGSKANQRIGMTIIGRPSPQIEVTSDLAVSSIWAGSPSITTDNITIRTKSQTLNTAVGTYWAEFTPLTLYYSTYSPWFEASYFQRQRENWQEEQGIVGNKRKLEGFYGEAEIDNLKLIGLMSRVRSKDGTSPYHRFLTGYSVTLFPTGNNFIGANWLRLADDPTTGGGKAVKGELLGVNWNTQLWKNLSCNGEYVRSLYDDDLKTGLAAVQDRAVVGELRWQMEKFLLQTRLVDVGPYYYAPTSQSRQYDLSNLELFGSDALPSAMGTTVPRTLEALPYGLATPNRAGYQLRALYRTGSRVLTAFERVDLKEQRAADAGGAITTATDKRRHFTVERIGAETDLTGFLKVGAWELPQKQLRLLGGLEKRTVTRSDDPATALDEELAFTALIRDLGLAYELYPGCRLIWGQKLAENRGALEGSYRTKTIGLELEIGPQTFAELSHQVVKANGNPEQNFEARITELSLKARF